MLKKKRKNALILSSLFFQAKSNGNKKLKETKRQTDVIENEIIRNG